MVSEHAEVVVLDATGLEHDDEELVARLETMLSAVRLMGGHCQLCGVRPGMSPLLAELSVVRTSQTSLTLGDALAAALTRLGYETVRRAG